MKRSRYWLIEVVVVTAVLVVLLIVMFPRFYYNQISVKVAQAKRDLHSIIQAMEAYNLSQGNAVVQAAFVWRDWSDTSIHTRNLFTGSRYSTGMYRLNPIPTDTLSPYLEPVPIPKLPFEINGTPETPGWGPMYGVARWELRNLKHDPKFATDVDQGLYWYNFYKDYYNAGYLGLAHGPLINHDYSKPTGANAADLRLQYRTYDPSNGTISHGYIVADTPPMSGQKEFEFPGETEPAPQWNDRPRPLQADTSQPAKAVRIEDAASLAAHHRILFSTLEITLYGTFKFNIRENLVDFFPQLRPDAVLGALPDGVTPTEVDEYYERRAEPQVFPAELTYSFNGEGKRRKRIQAPRVTRLPWSTFEDHIVNGNNVLHIDYTKKQYSIRRQATDSFLFDHVFFEPFWFIVPLKYIETADAVSMKQVSDTLYRIQWKKTLDQGFPEPVFSLDAVIDTSKGYLPVQVEILYPQFLQQDLEKGKRESDIAQLEGMYVEFDAFKTVEGVPFPTVWKLSRWKQIRSDSFTGFQSNEETDEPTEYLIKGLESPNIIDNGVIPPCYSQWDLKVESILINQPLDDAQFWPPVPPGFNLRDTRG